MFHLDLVDAANPSRVAGQPFSPQTAAKARGCAGPSPPRGCARIVLSVAGSSFTRRRASSSTLRAIPQPHQRGDALPQRGQRFSARGQPPPRYPRPLPRALLRPVGAEAARLGAGADRPARQGGARRRFRRRPTRKGRQLNSLHNASARSAARRWTIEENYLMKKLFGGGLGVVSIENQARI